MAGDQTATFQPGYRVVLTGSVTGTLYGVIETSVFSSVTTVTISVETGSLSNEALTVSLQNLEGITDTGAIILRNMTLDGDAKVQRCIWFDGCDEVQLWNVKAKKTWDEGGACIRLRAVKRYFGYAVEGDLSGNGLSATDGGNGFEAANCDYVFQYGFRGEQNHKMGWTVNSCRHVHGFGITAVNNGSSGITVESGGVTGDGRSYSVHLDGLIAYDNKSGSGLLVATAGARHTNISNGHFHHNQFGITGAKSSAGKSERISFANIICDYNDRHGIALEDGTGASFLNRVCFTNVHSDNNGQETANTWDGFHIGNANILMFTIQGGSAADTQGTATQRYGIHIGNAAVKGSVNGGIDLRGNVSGEMDWASEAVEVRIGDTLNDALNLTESDVSANDLDCKAVYDFAIIGTVQTINSFSNLPIGVPFTIHAGAAVTVSHGAGVQLSGSGNFVMANGDSLTLLRRSSTVIREQSRMVA